MAKYDTDKSIKSIHRNLRRKTAKITGRGKKKTKLYGGKK
jgi:hypothetical protein